MSSPNGANLRQRTKASSTQTGAAVQRSDTKTPIAKTPAYRDIHINPWVTFCLFLASHLAAALYTPISDCDEVFNYWEPTHYLTHGHGFQTWEYSPEYAIRSWAYNGIHALVTLIPRLLPITSKPKTIEFYFLRVVFAIVCALCEMRLFSKIASVLNARIAVTWSIIMMTSVGMTHASISYLPSSFAMYLVMLGTAAFMDWRGGLRTAQGIFCYGVGAALGWPFAAAMAIPFLLEELVLACLSDREGMIALFWRVVDGVVRTLIVLAVQVCIDWYFYKKLVLVPLNIVLYNVFSDKGPDLYGTEPWHYYIRNLFLNFNLWVILALLSLPALLLQNRLRAKGTTKASYLRGIVILLPFYLWLLIFTLQPHKEERFMYPAYPALALNAAITFHILLSNLNTRDPHDLLSRIPLPLRLLAITAFITVSLLLSFSRAFGLPTSYSAPTQILAPLHNPTIAHPGDTLCLGKEWHRFPSHYHLPLNLHAKFIRSEFRGLLPGEFSEARGPGFGFFPATSMTPLGMNDENREDLSKYTDLKGCTFLVDSLFESAVPSRQEPAFVRDGEHWERVKCVPHLDVQATTFLGRWGWMPQGVPGRLGGEVFKRRFGPYCLLKRKVQRMDGVPRIETLS